jgi:hypothetical protein
MRKMHSADRFEHRSIRREFARHSGPIPEILKETEQPLYPILSVPPEIQKDFNTLTGIRTVRRDRPQYATTVV